MNLHRLCLLAAAPAAALGVLEVVHTQPEVFADPLDWTIEIVFVVANIAAAVALSALAAANRGRGARAALAVAAAGPALLAVSATATAFAGHNTLGPVFLLGLLAWVGGSLAATVLDLGGRLTPRRAAVVLLLALVASIAMDATGAGGIVLAAGWLGCARLTAGRRELVPAT